MEFSNTLVLLIVGQVLTILVLLISNFINYRHTTRLYTKQVETEIAIKKQSEYLEKQLSEFYGPIQAMLAVQSLLIRLRWNPDTKEREKRIPDIVWSSIRDDIMIPNARKIAEIIISKYHLIDGIELSNSFKEYLSHAYMWPTRIAFLDQKDLEWTEHFRFPQQFEIDINEQAKRLKREYYHLINKQDVIS